MESLKGQFLVAMPGMGDERFREAVIYIVGHGEEGAMGLMVNQPLEDLKFADILDELGIAGQDAGIEVPSSVKDRAVLRGGPVQRGRGFVLHSPDYFREENSLRGQRRHLPHSDIGHPQVDGLPRYAERCGVCPRLLRLGGGPARERNRAQWLADRARFRATCCSAPRSTTATTWRSASWGSPAPR